MACSLCAMSSVAEGLEGRLTMRLVFAVTGLLIVLALVSVLVKRQLGPGAVAQAVATTSVPSEKNLRLQSQQIEQHVRQSLETAMQQPRVVDKE